MYTYILTYLDALCIDKYFMTFYFFDATLADYSHINVAAILVKAWMLYKHIKMNEENCCCSWNKDSYVYIYQPIAMSTKRDCKHSSVLHVR